METNNKKICTRFLLHEFPEHSTFFMRIDFFFHLLGSGEGGVRGSGGGGGSARR